MSRRLVSRYFENFLLLSTRMLPLKNDSSSSHGSTNSKNHNHKIVLCVVSIRIAIAKSKHASPIVTSVLLYLDNVLARAHCNYHVLIIALIINVIIVDKKHNTFSTA